MYTSICTCVCDVYISILQTIFMFWFIDVYRGPLPRMNSRFPATGCVSIPTCIYLYLRCENTYVYACVCKTYVYIYFISGAPQSSWPCQKSQSNSSIQILENLPHKFKVVFFSRLNLSRTMGVVNDFIVTALVFLKINSFFILFHDHSPIPS